MLCVSARLTWAGVSCGYLDLISAAIPATTALAAAVLLVVVYPSGAATIIPAPAAVSVT